MAVSKTTTEAATSPSMEDGGIATKTKELVNGGGASESSHRRNLSDGFGDEGGTPSTTVSPQVVARAPLPRPYKMRSRVRSVPLQQHPQAPAAAAVYGQQGAMSPAAYAAAYQQYYQQYAAAAAAYHQQTQQSPHYQTAAYGAYPPFLFPGPGVAGARAPPMSPLGNPLIPNLQDAAGPPGSPEGAGGEDGAPSKPTLHRKRKSREHANHRHSISATNVPPMFMMPPPPPPPGGYGAMDAAGATASTGGIGPVPPSADFSPRGEWRALAAPFASLHRKSSPGTATAPTAAPHRRTQSGTGRLDGSVRGVTFAPDVMNAGAGWEASPEYMSVYDAPPDGEAEPFVPSDFGGGGARGNSGRMKKMSSVRKMHMRHKSVELFMENVKGTEQPTSCRDLFFALLFYGQLAVMCYFGYVYGPRAFAESIAPPDMDADATTPTRLHFRSILIMACLCAVFAVLLSACALLLMMVIARRFLQAALLFSIGMAFCWGTVGIGLSPRSFVPVTGVIALALSIGYTFVVWDRLPFATANLTTALAGVRSAPFTLISTALLYQVVALAWSLGFLLVLVGVMDTLEQESLAQMNPMRRTATFVLLGISYYWTFQVISHTIQVTVAGVVGAWWFKQEEEKERDALGWWCLPDAALGKSLLRANLWSFGSICLGSLFVGPVQLLRQLAETVRPFRREDSTLLCLRECLVCKVVTSGVDSLAATVHPFAFTYVGLYGYNFWDSGKNATALFLRRGWSPIVTDDLIPNVLLMVSLVIGGVTGCFALLVQEMDGFGFSSLGAPATTAFLIGLLVGMVLSNILWSVLCSSVNVVLVCFAGSPVEFQTNHSELSNQMTSAWREVWPGCMQTVDGKSECRFRLDQTW